MKVFFNGVGDAFSKHSYNTSFVVQDSGFNLLVECPHPLFKIIEEHKRAKPEWPGIDEIDAVYLSHTHGDHMNGLEGFAFYKKFVKDQRVELYIPRYYSDMIWEERLRITMGFGIDNNADPIVFQEDFFFNKHVLYTSSIGKAGPFIIRIYQTIHYIPSFAIFISNGEKSISYSSDTRFNINLISWLNKADLIIHESNYGPGHTDWNNLRSLEKEVRSKMILVHLPDNFDAGTIAKADDGMILEV